jgi:copper chaperone CopZ
MDACEGCGAGVGSGTVSIGVAPRRDKCEIGKKPGDLPGRRAAQRSTRELRFRVGGMECAGCAPTVQHAIEGEPGVASAAVSVLDGMEVVQGGDVSPDRIAAKVRELGFSPPSPFSATSICRGCDPRSKSAGRAPRGTGDGARSSAFRCRRRRQRAAPAQAHSAPDSPLRHGSRFTVAVHVTTPSSTMRSTGVSATQSRSCGSVSSRA